MHCRCPEPRYALMADEQTCVLPRMTLVRWWATCNPPSPDGLTTMHAHAASRASWPLRGLVQGLTRDREAFTRFECPDRPIPATSPVKLAMGWSPVPR